MNKLNEFCEWEDCDQEPVYCEGHAHELVNPLGLNIRGQQTEIERLTAERDDWAAVSEMKDSQIAWLQARVETLEKVRKAVLTHRDNKEFLNIDTWNACVYAAEAATEQGESDGAA